MEAFIEFVKGQEDLSPDTASLLIQAIAIVPGWSEKNFQVLPPCFSLSGSRRSL